ncbi:hypothetical protein AWB69_07788 [Caballeronia udeis]|uniref:Alpha/beta hydrolase family protein n=1 Tax=Caballeronia udeis TaxID=1232866 RepID=A0A158JFA7_9BURK|nr:hypothetical protein [Caballeronia udeis]SAL67568.1 hypothetical protein AWB69_07788 [Caballeronia udeis]
MPGDTAYIIVHGSGQDGTSHRENTVKLAKHLRAIGEHVYEIGGPGSTERALKQYIEAVEGRIIRPIDEVGIPLDHAFELGFGMGAGGRLDNIVKEGEQAIYEFLRKGIRKFKIVGFSRGAVASVLLAQRLPIFRDIVDIQSIDLSLGLLDPVPGPILVPQHLVIPEYVKHTVLLIARDEGRPGFRHLSLQRENPRTRLTVDMIRGVHGDVGGSTQSGTTDLSLDYLVRNLEVPHRLLSLQERLDKIVETMMNSDRSVNLGIAQQYTRRDYGWGVPTSTPGDIVFPSYTHTQLFNQHFADADLFFPFSAEIQARLKEEQLKEAARLKEARLKEARLKQAQLRAAQWEWQQQQQREARAAAMERMRQEAAVTQRRMREWLERRAQQAEAERRRIRVVRPSPFAVTASGQILHPPPSIQLLDAGDVVKLFRYGKKLIFRK